MFTGIVDHTGTVEDIVSTPVSKELSIQSNFKDLQLGESISVNGVCLTVIRFKKGNFAVDVSSETLKLTNFRDLAQNSVVNLERALALGDRLGGHFVTGHVDSTVMVENVRTQNEYLEMTIGELDPRFKRYIHSKGCISLNGVSLTINQVTPDKSSFTVMLIPHTLERTNLSALRTGMRLNVEFDWMAKIVMERLDGFMPSLDIPLSSTFEKGRIFEDI